MTDVPLDYWVCVFSFNRGKHLEVCLESVQRNANAARIVVFDDGSDDPTTTRVLEAAEEYATVIRAPRLKSAGENRGGLHRNMERALADAQTHGVPFVLMLQDDMQIVRPVSGVDYLDWVAFFESNPNSIELYVTFDVHHEQSPNEWLLDTSGKALLPRWPKASDAYSDTGLFDVRRFQAIAGQLENTERRNVVKLAARGLVKGRACVPFTMFMPYPSTTRVGRSWRGVKTFVAEWLSGAGVHPYDTIQSERVAELRCQQCVAPPLARVWIYCPTMQHRRVWSYYGGARDLRAVGGIHGAAGWLLGGAPPRLRRKTRPGTNA